MKDLIVEEVRRNRHQTNPALILGTDRVVGPSDLEIREVLAVSGYSVSQGRVLGPRLGAIAHPEQHAAHHRKVADLHQEHSHGQE